MYAIAGYFFMKTVRRELKKGEVVILKVI